MIRDSNILLPPGGRSRSRLRWALVALPVALGALLLYSWARQEPASPVGRSLEFGELPESGAETIGSPASSGIGVAADAGRVAADREACPGDIPTEENLSVLVLNLAGDPVVGARVVVSEAHGVDLLGTADAEGRLEASIPLCPGQSLVVRAEGFAAAYVDLGSRFPQQVTVRMVAEWALNGRVTDEGGVPLPDMDVVAWPSHRSASGLEVARSVAGSRLFPQTRTDSQGRFVLNGLDGRTAHTLIAGGGGRVLADPIVVQSTTHREVEIRLWSLHALRRPVQVLGGGLPVLPREVATSGCTFLGLPKGRASRHIDPRSPQAILTDALRERMLQDSDYSLYESLLSFASPEGRGPLGPFRYRFCAPGYAPAEGELWVPHVSGSELEVEPILLKQSVPLFGAIEIRVHGRPTGTHPLHTAAGPALLLFARNATADCVYFLPVPDSDVSVLDGLLPTGRTQFVLGAMEWQQPNWNESFASIEISEGANLLDVDLSGLGGVEFDLYDYRGEPVLGPVQVELRDEHGGVLRRFDFHRAPYRAYGLDSGDYSLSVHGAYGLWDSTAHSDVFRVSSGEIAHVDCVSGEVKGR